MDSSETQQRTINLGKALVATLEERDHVDTLSAWMAHYVAELMELADRAGEDKAVAQHRCSEAILRLWKHRASMPSGHRPFEAFDEIIRTLDRLNPDDPRPYYHEIWRSRGKEEDEDEPKDIVVQLMQFATAADRLARIVVQYFVSVAVDKSTDDLTQSLLRNALGEEDAMDVAAYNKLLADLASGNPDLGAREREALKRKIDQTDQFLRMGQEVRRLLVEKLKDLEATSNQSTENS